MPPYLLVSLVEERSAGARNARVTPTSAIKDKGVRPWGRRTRIGCPPDVLYICGCFLEALEFLELCPWEVASLQEKRARRGQRKKQSFTGFRCLGTVSYSVLK